MSEPTLFGIGKAQWDLVNGFANWLSAIGTFAAAGVALYIANRAAKPSARLNVGHRIVFGAGIAKPYPEYLVFTVVNTGDRPIEIVQIGWRTGLRKRHRRHSVQLYDETQSSGLPIRLFHGQVAKWMVPLAEREEPWFEYFARGFLSADSELALRTLRAQAFTSTDHVIEAKPEAGVIRRLKEACDKVNAQKRAASTQDARR
jgi:hypothetical protein